MSTDPGALTNDATLQDAAVAMRDRDIGDVVVTKPDGTVCGIVTDRERILNGPFDLQLKYESRLFNSLRFLRREYAELQKRQLA